MIDHDWPACGLLRQPVMQHHIQKCLVNMDSTVIRYVAELAEVVHEFAYAGSSRSDHIRKLLLCDRRDHTLGFARLTELSHDK